MKILEELKKFLKTILHWVYSMLIFSFLFFSFGFKQVLIWGQNVTLPLPTGNSFSVQIFNKIQSDLLPKDVHLVVTNPMSAFISQILLSLFLAFIITFPFFLYKIMRYLSPALFKHERKLIIQSLLPAIFLFFSGCAFAYYFLVPASFKILYPYAIAINAVAFFSVNEFISSVLGLMITTGIMFLLPLFMTILSFTDIVGASIWKSHLHHAILFFLVFTAIITPDGTGVTMLILFLPLIMLYLLGCLLTQKLKKVTI